MRMVRRESVVLPIAEYKELLEDLEDLAVMAERSNEPTKQLDEVVKNLETSVSSKANMSEDENLNEYRAVIKREGDWWIDWTEEVPGVNCQEATRDELLETLRITLREALEFNRQEAIAAAGSDYEEELIAP